MNRILTLILLLTIQYVNGGSLHLKDRLRDVKPIYEKAKAVKLPEDHWSLSPAYRLPKSVLPTHYELKIIPILEEVAGHDRFTAPGSALIHVTCYEATNNITLHASEILRINESSVTVKSSQNVEIPIVGHEYNLIMDFYIVKLGQSLQVNQTYTIYIEFVAPVSQNILNGLYLSTYLKPETNQVSYVAATQFQMFAFRQMAPGFDEPNIKSTFDISIGYYPVKYNTLCNTDVISTSPIDHDAAFAGWTWDNYRRTVVTSPYLLALVVSDFTYTEAQPGLFRKPVRVYGVPHQIANGDAYYAAETSAKQLAFFEEYYLTEYDMPKLDSVAVPDFLYGAMENWGLNTYSTRLLLHTANVSTETERAGISLTLAHELGHQWFGNLVTCAWWNDIWLNEGLTTYASYFAWQHTQPEFEPLKNFHVNNFQNSLLTEEYGSSIGKEFENNGSQKIIDNFNHITARKGASLIKMMEGFLGIETVRRGTIRYLQELSYKGADQDDFFYYLNAQAEEDGTLPVEGLTIKDIMDTWTNNRGFPLLYISNAGNGINIHQQQYRSNDSTQEDSTGWFIPVSIATQDLPNFDVKPQLWLRPNETNIIHPLPDTSKWIVVNPSGKNYYRVIYDTHFTQLIWNVLESTHSIISQQSRSQLIDDYFMAAFQNATNFINLETALGFTKYVGRDSERIVWEALIGNLKSSFYRLLGTPTMEEFKNYFMPRISSVLRTIGFQQESYHKGANVILRGILLEWLCKMDSDECNAYTKQLFDAWKINPAINPFPVDLQNVLYCNAAAVGTPEDFEFIFQRYENGTSIQKVRLLSGLGCTKNITLLQSLLEEAIKVESRLDEADRLTAIQVVTGNVLGRSLALSFLNSNLGSLLNQFGTAGILRMVSTLSVNMRSIEERVEVERFITDNETLLDSIVGTLRGYLSNIQENIVWRENYEARLATWFRNNA